MAKLDPIPLLFTIILIDASTWAALGVSESLPARNSAPDLSPSHLDTETLTETSHHPGDYHYDYDDDDDGDDDVLDDIPGDVAGTSLPGLGEGSALKPVGPPGAKSENTLLCALHAKGAQHWKKSKGGKWMRKTRNTRRTEREIHCSGSCLTLWEMDSLNSTSVSIKKQ
ncbi:hypothetical protein EGW08_008469, partial [Elysia chlorotica]